MRKYLLFFICLIPFITMAQMCEVSGNQNGTWDCDTVMVVGDVFVLEGNSLIISEGTNVVFKDYYSIVVNGYFEAIGTEENPISFTAIDTTGFYMWDNGKGGWNGLVFRDIEETITLKYCNFSHGKAAGKDRRGGAVRIYNVDDMRIDNCLFYNNFTSDKGGALYAEHSNLIVTNCEVDGNLCYNDDEIYTHGAGFQFLNCVVNMEDMYFHDNYCESCYGGGVNFDSCEVKLNRAVFEGNYSVNAGGLGIQRSYDKNVHVSNVLFYDNTVYHYGGAMAVASSSPLVQNATMTDNHCIGAGGGAMQFFGGSNPTFKNCIIWGNGWLEGHSHNNASQIFVWGEDCAPSFYNSILQGGLKDVNGGDYIMVYENMLEIDPLFVDTLTRNYKLSENSPAINSGTIDTTGLSLPETDLAGMPRILGNRIDMGCYEFSGVFVNELQYENNNIKVSPNPLTMNSICTITLKKDSEVIVKIFNQLGMLISEKKYGTLPSGDNDIPLNDLFNNILQNKNVYLLSVETSDGVSSSKIIY